MTRLAYGDACQLCSQEPWTIAIEGIRIGERCHARVRAIAADANADLSPHVQRERHRGICCIECGTELEVDETATPLQLVCPRGHAVALITNERRERTSSPATTDGATGVCARCAKPVDRTPGQRGRPRKTHVVCP